MDLLAHACGLKSTAASSILSLVAPVLLGVLSKEQAAQGLGPAGLTSLLLGQKDTIARLAPAEAVKEALTRSGIEASRVATAGYGQERPIASNDTEAGKAKNRRLELAVVKR